MKRDIWADISYVDYAVQWQSESYRGTFPITIYTFGWYLLTYVFDDDEVVYDANTGEVAYDPKDSVVSTGINSIVVHDTSGMGFGDLTISTSAVTESLSEAIDRIREKFATDERKEDNMDLIKNFDFGSCERDNVKMSMYGIAVKNASGTWVSYDAKSDSVVDVDIFNITGKYLYKMPVATKDIKVGDTIIHNRKPMFVTSVEEKATRILAIDPAAAEEKIIIPIKNMFGFDFVTKIVNLFGNFADSASTDSPFGNMLPLMLMSDDKNSDNMLPMLFMMNGGEMDMSNPMMLYFLAKDSSNSNMLPLFLMMNNKTCDCGCKCEDPSH